MRWTAHDRGAELIATHGGEPKVAHMAAFTHGFYSLSEADGRLFVTDLRMGQEPAYVFRFALAQRQGDAWVPLPVPEQVGMRPDVGRAWAWLWRRALGQPVAPPR